MLKNLFSSFFGYLSSNSALEKKVKISQCSAVNINQRHNQADDSKSKPHTKPKQTGSWVSTPGASASSASENVLVTQIFIHPYSGGSSPSIGLYAKAR